MPEGRAAGHKRKRRARQPAGATALAANGATGATGTGFTATASATTAKLEAWLDENDVEWDACSLADTETMGRSVLAARDIAGGAVVLTVPDDAVLMPDDCCIAKVRSMIENAIWEASAQGFVPCDTPAHRGSSSMTAPPQRVASSHHRRSGARPAGGFPPPACLLPHASQRLNGLQSESALAL